MQSMKNPEGYWRANLRLLGGCLAVWALVSYVLGILLAEPLNNIQIAGYKLGFWFAQQGAIYFFLLIIAYYVMRMNRIDREFDVHED
jgi:putative solute:sodium symporter small subunit